MLNSINRPTKYTHKINHINHKVGQAFTREFHRDITRKLYYVKYLAVLTYKRIKLKADLRISCTCKLVRLLNEALTSAGFVTFTLSYELAHNNDISFCFR